MSDIESRVSELAENAIAETKRVAELYKPEWEARRDIAKTLISLSGATLVFTITFSQSVIKPDTPASWRYAVVACWLAFICSLVLSLASLWLSMELFSLPLLMTTEINALKEAARESVRTRQTDQFINVYARPFKKTSKLEMRALWSLRFSMFFYGAALLIFTIIGLRQLLT